jgi:hypothetical protein
MAMLEGRCALEATTRAQPEQIARLDAMHAELQRFAESNQIERFFEVNQEFHYQIQEMSGNRWLRQVIQDLRKVLKLTRLFSLSIDGRVQQSLAEHAIILEAIKAGDAAARKTRCTITFCRTAGAGQEQRQARTADMSGSVFYARVPKGCHGHPVESGQTQRHRLCHVAEPGRDRRELSDDEEVRCVVCVATVRQAFAAGGDIEEFLSRRDTSSGRWPTMRRRAPLCKLWPTVASRRSRCCRGRASVVGWRLPRSATCASPASRRAFGAPINKLGFSMYPARWPVCCVWPDRHAAGNPARRAHSRRA